MKRPLLKTALLLLTALAGIFAACALAAGCNTAELYVPPPEPVEQLPDSSIDRSIPEEADLGEAATPDDAQPDTTPEDPMDSTVEMDSATAEDAKTDAKDASADAKHDG